MKTLALFLIALAGCLAALLGLRRLDAWLERKFLKLSCAWSILVALVLVLNSPAGYWMAAADAVPGRSPAGPFVGRPGLLSVCLPSAVSSASAVRLAALSMIESGDSDAAVGRAREVSRFQITPAVWRQYAGGLDPANPFTAWNTAAAIMHDRCKAFERRFHRPCTDAEFYILWARPALLIGPGRPIHAALRDRAARFVNLVKLHQP